ncbi:MAG TPA: LLM class flavin-dependent oxidoreductase [Polyangiaceae bacterium]|nr:LLM class flavin-dependent oxidoreductase [Polyangiaceae bacterium]
MIFDLFHSLGDPVVRGKSLGAARCFGQFIAQVQLAEALGMRAVWCAESHFSSEAQKASARPSIPHYAGEVGLNADSFQLFHWIVAHTERIGLGTAIHNIVGGSGGPIASADRVNLLRFMNEECWARPREIGIGIASGRFPYQNAPFGLTPRNRLEALAWPLFERIAFYEAVEIFLRLTAGERLSSADLEPHELSRERVLATVAHAAKTKADPAEVAEREALEAELAGFSFPHRVAPRWTFETLQLMPACPSQHLRFVLGSSDAKALAIARRHTAVDLFNLSFTPPERIEALHAELAADDPTWKRERLPRTVLVFADPSRERARERADAALEVYIEAMRGTAQVPDKQVLLARALVGDAAELRERLAAGNAHGFHAADRLMLWFEFNQLEGAEIEAQMRYFFEEVVEKL